LKTDRKTSWMFAAWALAVVFIGGVLTSYHQPFRTPDEKILSLVKDPGRGRWRALHVLSGSCGCSQKVMAHLLKRHLFDGLVEQVLVIDGGEAYLPGSDALLTKLAQQGFAVFHLAANDISQDIGLRGVPLLIFASPENKILYMAGYGSLEDQDTKILQQIRAGQRPKGLPVLGCAVGSRVRSKADPFRLKY
jgi:hypothetical protein